MDLYIILIAFIIWVIYQVNKELDCQILKKKIYSDLHDSYVKSMEETKKREEQYRKEQEEWNKKVQRNNELDRLALERRYKEEEEQRRKVEEFKKKYF